MRSNPPIQLPSPTYDGHFRAPAGCVSIFKKLGRAMPKKLIETACPSLEAVHEFDEAAPAERLHALDAVRGFALLLGIILHATISFIPEPTRSYFIQDSHPSMTLTVVFFTIHIFRMTTFFLIAGFFARIILHRRGNANFIKDRLQRIAVPLVLGWPILFPATQAVVSWAATFPNGGPLPGVVDWPPVLPRFPLDYLWFLYVLLECYAATLVLRTSLAWLDKNGRLRMLLDHLVGLAVRSNLAPLILAVPIGIALNMDPFWEYGIRTPNGSLITNKQAVLAFGTAFSFGWLLQRQNHLIQFIERRWLFNLVLAIGLIATSFLIAFQFFQIDPGLRPAGIWFAGATCYALATWVATFAVIGVALRFLPNFSATRRYLADASYWMYLIHLPIVMALQVLVSSLDWAWPVKFMTILLVAFLVMLVSYQSLVRYSVLGAVLNGRRRKQINVRITPQMARLSRPASKAEEHQSTTLIR